MPYCENVNDVHGLKLSFGMHQNHKLSRPFEFQKRSFRLMKLNTKDKPYMCAVSQSRLNKKKNDQKPQKNMKNKKPDREQEREAHEKYRNNLGSTCLNLHNSMCSAVYCPKKNLCAFRWITCAFVVTLT